MPTPVAKQLSAAAIKPDVVRELPQKRTEPPDSVDFEQVLKQKRSRPRDEAQGPQPRTSAKADKPAKAQRTAKAGKSKSDEQPAAPEPSLAAPPTASAEEESPAEPTLAEAGVVGAETPAHQGDAPATPVASAQSQVTAVEPGVAAAVKPAQVDQPAATAVVDGPDEPDESAGQRPAQPVAIRAHTEIGPENNRAERQQPLASPPAEGGSAIRSLPSEAQGATRPATIDQPARDASVAHPPAPDVSGEAGESHPAPGARSKPDQPALKGGESNPTTPTAATERPATTSASPLPETATAQSPAAEPLLSSPQKPLPALPDQPVPAPAPSTPREIDFAARNHDQLVTAIRTQLLPKGGTMQIRLDPPHLGALQVAVTMDDGVMSVAFQTSSDEATRLLSHSLTQLKHVLESQGLSVDKLNVQQAPRDHDSTRQDGSQQRQHDLQDESAARQQQQRQELLRRMWRRLALGNDPLDLVA